MDEQLFGEYTVRTYSAWLCCIGSFEIRKGGQSIYARRGGRFWVGRFWGPNENEYTVPLGQDITGDGLPNLVLREYTGGAHCCSYYYVFTIGPEFRFIETIVGGDYDSYLKDLDGDGNWEFVVHDWVILPCTIWACCCGPDPYVILHYEDGAYHLALDLMRKPAPSAEDLEQWAQELEPHERNAALWDAVLDLIYMGHPELVEPFLEFVWPDEEERRDALMDSVFRGILPSSLYWPELKELSPEWPWPEDGSNP